MFNTKSRRGSKKKARSNTPQSPGKRWLGRVCLLILGASLVGLVGFVLQVDNVVREKFDGKKWSLPAIVYARPLELYIGLPLHVEDLSYELKLLGYRSVSTLRKPGDVVFKGSHFQIYTRSFRFWDHDEPAKKMTLTIHQGEITQLAEIDGSPLSVVRLDPQQIGGIYPAQREDRLLVKLSDIPPLLGETLIAVEDRNFLHHWGISLQAVTRAALANIKAKKIVQGGSTLTQQLVKNFYLNHKRDFSRKIKEALMSVLLEFHYSKPEILETYLNEVFLGQSGPRSIHGFALASKHYFNQPLAELQPAQIALLVGLVKGASYYNPWRYPNRAKKRRDLVLKVMAETGLISQTEQSVALTEPLGVIPPEKQKLHTYPAFIDLVKRHLRREYRDEDLRTEGLRVFTTLSPFVQKKAEKSLKRRLQKLESRHSLKTDTINGAVIVTSVGDGEVMAVVGGRKVRYAGFNRALDARRQVGSLIKPAVFLAALAQPHKYTLITPISDDPVRVVSREGHLWQPRNFSLVNHGQVPLIRALTHSYNQSSARLGMDLGLDTVIKTLQKLGLDKPMPAVPAILLGAVELSPYDIANLYHTMAAEGVYTPLRAIRAVMTSQGKPLKRYPLDIEQRFTPDSTHLLQYGLQMVMRSGTGRSAYQRLPESLRIAGKTGTTDDNRDSWFSGFSGDHLAVVWLGRDDNGSTPLTGSNGALQVWTDLFSQLSTRSLVFEKPQQVDYEWVDIDTAQLSRESCLGAQPMPFINGSQPTQHSPCSRAKNPVTQWFKELLN